MVGWYVGGGQPQGLYLTEIHVQGLGGYQIASRRQEKAVLMLWIRSRSRMLATTQGFSPREYFAVYNIKIKIIETCVGKEI